jgi:hypothetical protein
MSRTVRMFGQDVEIPAEAEVVGPVGGPVVEDATFTDLLEKLEEFNAIEEAEINDIDPKLNEWLDETDRLARLHDDYYFNPHLGYPKYGNGLDHLYPEKSPQEALDWWVHAVVVQEDEDGVTFDVPSEEQ